MTTLKIDPITGDIAFVNNNAVLIQGADEVTQVVKGRLKTFLGEWYLDTSIGLPFYQLIFVKGASPQRIALFIKKEIRESPGVISLDEYSQDYDGKTRGFNVKTKIKASDDSILTINEVIS